MNGLESCLCKHSHIIVRSIPSLAPFEFFYGFVPVKSTPLPDLPR